MLSLTCLVFISMAKAQFSPTKFAEKIAQKMQDSLVLTSDQKAQVYNINMLLHTEKMDVRQKYPKDSVRYYLQKVENTRDSLYHNVLADDKFTLYRQKKVMLVNNN